MHPLSQIIYPCKTLYVAFPCIIRSSKLRIQRRYGICQTAAATGC